MNQDKNQTLQLTATNKGNELDTQFEMDLKKTKFERLYTYKNKSRRFLAYIQIFSFWKRASTAIVITTSVASVIWISLSLIYFYSSLNTKVPLIFLQATNSWQLVDKEVLLFIPILIALVMIIMLNLNSAIYKFDKRLANLINFSIAIFNILGLIAFYQLLSLLLLY